jgi:hypothetical protein
MSHSRCQALIYLLGASVGLAACSLDEAKEAERKQLEEAVGVHFLLLAQGKTEGEGGCVLLVADGSGLSGSGAQAPIAPDAIRKELDMQDGKASFRYYIQPEPGQATAQPRGELALEIEVQQGSFRIGDAQLEHFATRAGTEHAVYVWGESGCVEHHQVLPAWVQQRVMARQP